MRLLQTALLILFLNNLVFAQDGVNQLNYSSLAQQIIQTNINGDPQSSILPSVAIDNGYGSFLENPAAMALINDSYFSMGYLVNHGENNSSFNNTSSSIDGKIGEFSNIGLVYSAPTTQGSFVIGGGYTINNSTNRKNLLSSENTITTITDTFKDINSSYHDIAFETYAIDYMDVEQTSLESIFRIGFDEGNFPGIYQDVEITQQSTVGELSIFGAVEFQKNLFFGISLALVSGNYSYSRDFLERDLNNVYNGDFLFQDDNGLNGTDIDAMLLHDEIESEILGSSVRTGLVYEIMPNLNLGISYAFPNKYFFTEDYYSFIRTSFDDTSISEDSFEGDFTYEVKRPGQLNFGLALVNIAGFTFSGSVELIDYRNTEVTLTSDPDLSFEDISILRDEENLMAKQINRDYNSVVNVKAGIKYHIDNALELRGGFTSYPGKSNRFSADRNIFSIGLGIPVSRDISIDISSQYSRWNDRSIVYEYFDSEAGQVRNETITEDLTQLNILIGLKFKF
jgi:long-subunit fatty acid transport protein